MPIRDGAPSRTSTRNARNGTGTARSPRRSRHELRRLGDSPAVEFLISLPSSGLGGNWEAASAGIRSPRTWPARSPSSSIRSTSSCPRMPGSFPPLPEPPHKVVGIVVGPQLRSYSSQAQDRVGGTGRAIRVEMLLVPVQQVMVFARDLVAPRSRLPRNSVGMCAIRRCIEPSAPRRRLHEHAIAPRAGRLAGDAMLSCVRPDCRTKGHRAR